MRILANQSEWLVEQGILEAKVSEENEGIRFQVANISNVTQFTNTELQQFKMLWADVKCYM